MMPVDDLTGPPTPLGNLFDDLNRLIDPVRRVTVVATLSGWKTTNRRWAHGDLCSVDPTGTISERLPMTVPPEVLHAARRQAAAILADGALVEVRGRVEIGDRWNPLRIVAESVRVIEAESSSECSKRQLVEQLEVSGAVSRNRSQRLPVILGRVGLISPAGGEAGRADFLHRLGHSPSPVAVLERRVPMSGPRAPAVIAAAVEELSGSVDAVFVCRGGGPRADLAAFDSSAVVTAIVRSATPVIVAVGHSTDETVSDRVAHTSLPTPTAAGNWIVERGVALAAQARDEHYRSTVISAQASAVVALQRAERDRFVADRSRRQARPLAIAAAVTLAVVLAVALVLLAR